MSIYRIQKEFFANITPHQLEEMLSIFERDENGDILIPYKHKGYSCNDIKVNKNNSVKAISMFSGAGGLDIGTQLAGVPVLSSLDIFEDSVRTMQQNAVFNDTLHECGDITKITGEHYAALIKRENPEKLVIVGGPPCQPFSKAGYWVTNEKRNSNEDPRNLIKPYFRIISELQPDGFVLENVESIANNLDKENVPTRFEGSNWYNKTVINILKNEKYCGDVLFQKTYSPGALSRVKQNRGELPQYYVRDALPAIIDRKTWEITQMEYARRVKQSSGQPSPEYPFEGRIFCGVCGRTVVYCRFRARGGYIPWWRCSTKVTRLKRSDDMTHDDCRIPIDRPTQVFVQAWNLVVSKRLQYEPRLWRIAEKDNNELTRYHASVMLRLIDEIGKLDNFDYMLSLRTLDHMELQLDGKLTVVFLGGIRITI